MKLENEIIDYDESKKDILHWTKLKGEYRYFSIIEFLKGKNIKCTWNNVTNYIKYDKRILINSFKYIVFLEELYKSFIIQYSDIEQDKLLKLDFSVTLDKYLSLKDKANYDGIDLELLKKEKRTINAYRNQVVHNKIILCDKYEGKELEETLKIFIRILPISYRNGFIEDINKCSKNLVETLWHIELSND